MRTRIVVPMVMVLALVAMPGCSWLWPRDITQDYASCLRIYTGTATLATSAITSGMLTPEQVAVIKKADADAFAALKLLAAAVNAKDEKSFDSYLRLFNEAVALMNTLTQKGVTHGTPGGTTQPVSVKPGGGQVDRDGLRPALWVYRAGREPDAGTDCRAGIGGLGRSLDLAERRTAPALRPTAWLGLVIDLACGDAQAATTEPAVSRTSDSRDMWIAILGTVSAITSLLAGLLGKKAATQKTRATEMTDILNAVTAGVKIYAETQRTKPNSEITTVIQNIAESKNVEGALHAHLVGTGLMAQ